MIIKSLVDEDFVNYKKPSMVVLFPNCSFKCEVDCGKRVCQNGALANSKNTTISAHQICTRYLSNSITQSIVCGGLEPMDSFDDLLLLISTLRNAYLCRDDIVVYTGYTEAECTERGWLQQLTTMKNIIVKFGRFIPDQTQHYDEVLGIKLASDNQYAKRIS